MTLVARAEGACSFSRVSLLSVRRTHLAGIHDMTDGLSVEDDRPKGPRFTKVYEAGWDRVEQLLTLKGGPTVGRLWLFLVRHAGHENALVVTVEQLALELDVHARSVMRASRVLRDSGALDVVKLGTANVYVLNPAEVWKTAEDHKRFCSFGARVLVGFKENASLRRRLTHFVAQPSLPEMEAGS